MRLTLLLLFLPLLNLKPVKAQNFAPVGAKWYYTQYSATGPEIGYTYIESLRDTVIDGVECREIGGSPSPCAWTAQYVYDSNDSVFFWHPQREEFCLLYDFGAQVGDRWTIYHISSSFGSGQIDSSIVQIDSVGTEIIDGHVLRRLDVSQLNPTQDYWIAGGRVIERIGNLIYLFPAYGACDPLPGNLRCYQDSVVNYRQGEYQCDEVISSIDERVESTLSIYPNPTSDYVTIELAEADMRDLNVQLIDQNGRIVPPQPLYITEDRVCLSVLNLDVGIYFVETYTTNEIYRTKIFIVK